MEKVVDSEGSTKCMIFLDERKTFVFLVFSPISQNPCQKCEKLLKSKKVKK